MFCHRKAMGLGGKSIAFLPHFSRFFGEKTAFFRRKRYARNFNTLSLSSLQNFARFQNLEATRQLVNKIARKWHLQKSKCKRIPWFSLQSVIACLMLRRVFNKNNKKPAFQFEGYAPDVVSACFPLWASSQTKPSVTPSTLVGLFNLKSEKQRKPSAEQKLACNHGLWCLAERCWKHQEPHRRVL